VQAYADDKSHGATARIESSESPTQIRTRTPYLFLDGFVVSVRHDVACIARGILPTVGMRETGEEVVCALRVVARETTAGRLGNLSGHGLRPPRVRILDGSLGLRATVIAVWPHVRNPSVRSAQAVQPAGPCPIGPCGCPSQFHGIVYASTVAEAQGAQRAYATFVRRWRRGVPPLSEASRKRAWSY
jgi:hypothetical protein